MPATPHFLENHERCILDSYLICTIWLCDVISQFSLHSIFLDILYNKKEMCGLITQCAVKPRPLGLGI